MPSVKYLALLDVEALHDFIMQLTGDAPSHLRERGLLESAVMRPQTAAYYSDADLIEQATLLAVGISQAPAYVEGNKRTAFIATDAFLRENGYAFSGDPLEMSHRLEAVAIHQGSLDEAEVSFTAWLRENVSPQEQ